MSKVVNLNDYKELDIKQKKIVHKVNKAIYELIKLREELLNTKVKNDTHKDRTD